MISHKVSFERFFAKALSFIANRKALVLSITLAASADLLNTKALGGILARKRFCISSISSGLPLTKSSFAYSH